jgi:predicted XRE-type DNA-binding protein
VAGLAGLAVVWLLLASMLAPVALGVEYARQRDVDAVVQGAIERLRATLAYLEAVSPSEASKLREAFDRAISRLEGARGGAPEVALVEVVRAQVEALNASRGLLSRVDVAHPPGLAVALDVRLGMVEELRATVEYLRSASVAVEPWVDVKLEETARNIRALREGLASGALNASQVAVKLGEVNRNISEVRVYLAKTARQGWVKAHVLGNIAREMASAIRSSEAALRGDVGELVASLERLGRIPEVLPPGAPGREVVEEVARCILQVTPGNKTFVVMSTIAKTLRESKEEVKIRLLVAEILRCLKQPLERIPLDEVPAKHRPDVEKARGKVGALEEEARRSTLHVAERNPVAVAGLLRAELEHLQKLYRDYKEGRATAEEVKLQAQLVLKLAETAEQIAGKLPMPAQDKIMEVVEIARSEVNRILSELGTRNAKPDRGNLVKSTGLEEERGHSCAPAPVARAASQH